MKPDRRKLSKKHTRARERPQRHGANCGVCARTPENRARQVKHDLAKQLKEDLICWSLCWFCRRDLYEGNFVGNMCPVCFWY